MSKWLSRLAENTPETLNPTPYKNYKMDSVGFVGSEVTRGDEQGDLICWRDCSPEQLQILWNRVTRGEPVWLYSDTLGEAVYWVRDQTLADELRRRGVIEACYTLAELKELAGKAPAFLQDIQEFKEPFNATLTQVVPVPLSADATYPNAGHAKNDGGLKNQKLAIFPPNPAGGESGDPADSLVPATGDYEDF